MARKKGMGNLQKERDGNWTLRVCIHGKRISRTTGTNDRQQAEAYLERFLAAYGRGSKCLKLADVWFEYVKSPNRRDLSPSTLNAKRMVWMHFARWVEDNHIEITELKHVMPETVAEYLAELRLDHTASTYNARVCVLREMFRVLTDKAGLVVDPWAGVCLRADDSHSRRELSVDEVNRLYKSACEYGDDWRKLFTIGIYTGLRMGDCCRLAWGEVKLDEKVIQVIPEKTKKHSKKRPVTIPIHSCLWKVLEETPVEKRVGYVLPEVAEAYNCRMWVISGAMKKIFESARIKMSVKLDGRTRLTPEATFHSLRHTFVSLSANAGVPLPVVQSIVGHTSTAMTRHYYHENVDALRQAVAAIPIIGVESEKIENVLNVSEAVQHGDSIESRLKKLILLADEGLISSEEFSTLRARVLSEI